MAQSLTIRCALPADAAKVQATLLIAKGEVPLKPVFVSGDHRAWVEEQCRRRQVWLAEFGGHLVGVLVMRVSEVFFLMTLPACRRRGVGRCLIRHAVGMVARQYHCGVTARTKPNSPMLALLAAEGFAPHPALAAPPGWLVYSIGRC